MAGSLTGQPQRGTTPTAAFRQGLGAQARWLPQYQQVLDFAKLRTSASGARMGEDAQAMMRRFGELERQQRLQSIQGLMGQVGLAGAERYEARREKTREDEFLERLKRERILGRTGGPLSAAAVERLRKEYFPESGRYEEPAGLPLVPEGYW